MTSDYLWDKGLPSEKMATDKEYEEINEEIHNEIVKDNGKITYSHKVFFVY